MFFTSNEDKNIVNPKQFLQGRKVINSNTQDNNLETISNNNHKESPEKITDLKISQQDIQVVLKKPQIFNEPLTSNSPLLLEKKSEPEGNPDSINQLKQDLIIKDDHIKTLQNQMYNHTNKNQYTTNLAINKEMFDKLYIQEKKRNNSLALTMQISEIEIKKKAELAEREREKLLRLNMLEKIKEDKAREHLEYQRRVAEYRSQLDTQKAYIKDLRFNESIRGRLEKPGEFYMDHIIDSPNAGYYSGLGKYTKKSPRNLAYNPITGVLRETYIDNTRINNGYQETGSVYNGYSNYQPKKNVFKSQEFTLDEKGRNLASYGSIVMKGK
ncbi:hypothetical protein SteCoe_23071 [Stentor coeruleus]|uniref:Uncharacterized protein n=1 Tax=Stentor coeruleus TaxID=5963 RepID=A0A1R2BKT0_9CILI|nr:hypothetical protein SteCoe_23071 [Stentor coeruleus]